MGHRGGQKRQQYQTGGKNNNTIQTPDSDDDLSCRRDKLSQIYQKLKMQAHSLVSAE